MLGLCLNFAFKFRVQILYQLCEATIIKSIMPYLKLMMKTDGMALPMLDFWRRSRYNWHISTRWWTVDSYILFWRVHSTSDGSGCRYRRWGCRGWSGNGPKWGTNQCDVYYSVIVMCEHKWCEVFDFFSGKIDDVPDAHGLLRRHRVDDKSGQTSLKRKMKK